MDDEDACFAVYPLLAVRLFLFAIHHSARA